MTDQPPASGDHHPVPDDDDVVDGELVSGVPGPGPLPGGVGDLLGGGIENLDLGAVLGGVDLNSLLGAAQGLQQQMADAQERIASTVVEGVAGGGAVKISVTGDHRFTKVEIDPGAVDPDDITLLEDLVLAALHDAMDRLEDLGGDENPFGSLGGLFGGM